MKTKVCTRCYEEKGLDSFYKSKKGKFGRVSKCKVCYRADMPKFNRTVPNDIPVKSYADYLREAGLEDYYKRYMQYEY